MPFIKRTFDYQLYFSEKSVFKLKGKFKKCCLFLEEKKSKNEHG